MKKYFSKLKTLYLNSSLLASLAIFFLFFFFLGSIFIYKTNQAVIDDHFFNVHYSYLLRTQGWKKVVNDFDWVYMNNSDLSKGEHSRVYKISLYNIFLIVFTFLKNQFLALKMVDVFFASLFLSIIYYILRKIKIKYPLLILLFFVSISSNFLFRILLGRALVLSVALSFLEIYFAIEKKYKHLFLAVIFHIMWHSTTFFFPFLSVGIVEAGRYLNERKIYLKNILAMLLAIILGIMIYPDFLKNFYFIIKDILTTINQTSNSNVPTGSEVHSKNFFKSLAKNRLYLLFTIFGSITTFYYYIAKKKQLINPRKIDKKLFTYLFTYFMFLIVIIAGFLIASGRFFDYFFPAVLFLLVVSLIILFNDKVIILNKKFKIIAKISFSIFIIIMFFNTAFSVKKSFSKLSFPELKDVANWIAHYSQKRDRVYLNNWSFFSQLFFYNDKVLYSMGMEPTVALVENPDLYWKWFNFSHNYFYCAKRKNCNQEKKEKFKEIDKLTKEQQDRFFKENSRKIIKSIGKDFGAKFIVSRNKAFNFLLNRNKEMFERQAKIKNKQGKVVFEVFQLKDKYVK